MIVLRRQLYSSSDYSFVIDGELYQQKQFGLISDIKNSGLKRTGKKIAGRVRRGIADVVGASLEVPKAMNQLATKKVVDVGLFGSTTKKLKINKEIERELLKDIKAQGGRTLGNHGEFGPGSYAITPEAAKSAADLFEKAGNKRLAKKLRNEGVKGTYQIVYEPGTGTAYLAHEYGHMQNSKGESGKIRNYINKVSGDPETRQDFTNALMETDKKGGLKEAVSRVGKGAAIVAEEANASRAGLKYMKEHGASKEELKDARKNLFNAGMTYVTGVPIYVGKAVENGIRPKMGTRTFKNMDYDQLSNVRRVKNSDFPTYQARLDEERAKKFKL